MCQATPPAGSNPTSRGAGNTFGSSPSSPGIPEAPADPSARGAGNTFGSTSAPDPSNNYGAPAGANAGLVASRAREGDGFGTQSFADHGFSGVGTPTPTPPAASTGGIPGIVGPRMMDTGPLFGSQATPTKSSVGMSSLAGGTTNAPPFVSPSPQLPAGGESSSTTYQDPFIVRDQMYGLNPTPVDNVSNALMRRYRSYYNR